MQKLNLDQKPHTFLKVDLKWLRDLNIKYKTVKLLEENAREYFHDLE